MGQFWEVLDRLLDRFSRPSPITVAALVACVAVLNVEPLGRLLRMDFGEGAPKEWHWALWLVVVYTGSVMAIAATRLIATSFVTGVRRIRWHPHINPYSAGEQKFLGNWILGTHQVTPYKLEQLFNSTLEDPIQVHVAINRFVSRGYFIHTAGGHLRMTAAGIEAVSKYVKRA